MGRSPRTPWWSPDAHADARRPWTRPRSVARRGRSSSGCAAGRSGRRGSAAGGRGSGAETCGPRSSTCWLRGSRGTATRSSRRSARAPRASRRPSAGSVYPALQQLEDEALIRAEAGEDSAPDVHAERGRPRIRRGARRRAQGVLGRRDRQCQRHRGPTAAHDPPGHGGRVGGGPGGLRGPGPAGRQDPAYTRRALYRILATDGEDAEEDSQG